MSLSSSKTASMPVRRCDLNLSEEDEEDDDSGDNADSRKVTEEIKTRFAQLCLGNKSGRFTPKVEISTSISDAFERKIPDSCTKNLTETTVNRTLGDSKTSFVINTPVIAYDLNKFSNSKSTENKENEDFNTPYFTRTRPLEVAKDAKKALFSPANVVYSSKKVINRDDRYLSSINENDNFMQSLAFKDISQPKSINEAISDVFQVNHVKSALQFPNKQLAAEKKVQSISNQPTDLDFKIPEIKVNSSKLCENSSFHVETNNGEFSKIIFDNATYVIGQKLGSGGSSIVYLATEENKLIKTAIKVVKLDGDVQLIQGYLNEVKLLSKLQNSDVVIKMFHYAHLVKDNILYVVMECGETDFNSIIKTSSANNKYPVFPIVTLMRYWLQMLEAVHFIHNNGVIHSDLKPANFLKVGNRLKLIDFGIASTIGSDCTSIIKHVQTGTFNYMSPEALQDSAPVDKANVDKQLNIKISYKSDVWSLGCILYLLLYGKTPFGHINRPVLKMAAITDPKYVIDFKELDLYPVIFVKTAKKCLIHNPYDRPTVAELLQIPREPFECPAE